MKKNSDPRRKGHNFERLIAKLFKENLNHKVVTTRSSSRRLDDCGIDLVGTDSLIQCKAGYENRRPRFEEVYSYIKNNIVTIYGDNSKLEAYPILLIHNIDVGKGSKRGVEHTTVTMSLHDYFRLRNGDLPPVLEIF